VGAAAVRFCHCADSSAQDRQVLSNGLNSSPPYSGSAGRPCRRSNHLTVARSSLRFLVTGAWYLALYVLCFFVSNVRLRVRCLLRPRYCSKRTRHLMAETRVILGHSARLISSLCDDLRHYDRYFCRVCHSSARVVRFYQEKQKARLSWVASSHGFFAVQPAARTTICFESQLSATAEIRTRGVPELPYWARRLWKMGEWRRRPPAISAPVSKAALEPGQGCRRTGSGPLLSDPSRMTPSFNRPMQSRPIQ